jgi:hypothetical protein
MYNPETGEIIIPATDLEAEQLKTEGFLTIKSLEVQDRLHSIARKGQRFTLKPGSLLDSAKAAAALPAKKNPRKRKA